MRTPRQERSRASTERVLAAVLDLAAEGSLDAVTVGAVASRAGVSVGAIYGRFGDKTALVLAAQERFLATVSLAVGSRVVQALAPEAGAEGAEGRGDAARRVVRVVITAAVDAFAQHEALIRAFSAGARTHPELEKRAEAAASQVFAEVLTATGPFHDRIEHPDPATALDVLYRMLFATLERRVESATFISGLPIEWSRLADELVDLAIAYLRVREDGTP
ncbi:TetR/AcrR family transcriptional regulator [Spongisporangium articulatum]|uniref:TetR/AcrR family transcriptional regulator n=1 Tax=Spongisporangium articulatum TaxID=3362603 RepID=A0ABW8AKK3_9ACTN